MARLQFLEQISARFDDARDRLALVEADATLTYGDLDDRSQQLHERLAERIAPADRGRPVALDIPRSADLIVAALAVFRIGGGVVPLDPSSPQRRTRVLLEQARPAAIVSRQDGPGSLKVVALDQPDLAEAGVPPLHHLAYVLFTSGSTGEPKAVAMPRIALDALCAWHAQHEGDKPSTTSHLAPPTFDVAWQEILTTLTRGGTLIIPPDPARADPAALWHLLREHQVDRLFLPTAILDRFATWAQERPMLPNLRRVLVAGSQLRVTNAVRRWFAAMPECVLHNQYGPTETHVVTDYQLSGNPASWPDLPPIGAPLDHVGAHVDHEDGGGLLISGPCLADGYLGRPDLTMERFIWRDGVRLYRTGDIVEGELALHYIGRADRMIKVDGFRVEPGEVEAALDEHPLVQQVHVDLVTPNQSGGRLTAFIVADGASPSLEQELREALTSKLPDWMCPVRYHFLTAIPLTANGKVDRAALPSSGRRPDLGVPFAPPAAGVECELAAIWRELLDLDRIGRNDIFFEVGGTSLLMLRLAEGIRAAYGLDFPIADLYANPTIASMNALIHNEEHENPHEAVITRPASDAEPIAVIGMACRFPGADTPRAFYRSLLQAEDLITRRTVPPGQSTVVAGGILEGVDLFDAAYFGIAPKEAEVLDPQHRFFMECSWEALEDAAIVPADFSGRISVFAGCGPSSYLINNVLRSKNAPDGPYTFVSCGEQASLLMATSQDFLANHVSYRLGLRGPSVNVNGACATSLMAVHYAVQSLRGGESDVALAGAASIQTPQLTGYTQDGILPLSPDGICRVFDEQSAGTVFGSGVGVLVMKKLSDARRDGNDIHAVILGTGTANDGAQKVGMTAPSVDGQVRAIRDALQSAHVDPSTITYVEAHGTGTPVGDPIEIAALRVGYGPPSPRTRWVGSVKSHVGHLGWAAGMAGLIGSIIGLREGRIAPTIHFTKPNPQLKLSKAGYSVLTPCKPDGAFGHTRVGVNALGLGGSNAHVILEQAPSAEDREAKPESGLVWRLLPVSARTSAALDASIERLATELESSQVPLDDLSHTLSLGRGHDEWRSIACVKYGVGSPAALRDLIGKGRRVATPGPLAVVFPGHGTEVVGFGHALYTRFLEFRDGLHQFDAVAREEIGLTIPEILYTGEPGARIEDPAQVHAVVFATQIALLNLMADYGVAPDIFLGHSLGQYAAACAAGVFSAKTGLRIAIERGRALADTDPNGTMHVVHADEVSVRSMIERCGAPVDIAVLNAPDRTVVSGLRDDLSHLGRLFERAGIEVRPLGSLRAGHSQLVGHAAQRLEKALRDAELATPTKTLVSNLDGRVAGPEVIDPSYWGAHLRSAVRFTDCIATLDDLGVGVVVQAGTAPGVLGVVASQLAGCESAIPLLRKGFDDDQAFLCALGELWTTGATVDWGRLSIPQGRLLHLPTYPFQRSRHWVGDHPPIAHGPALRETARLLHAVSWTRFDAPAIASAPRVGNHAHVCGKPSALLHHLQKVMKHEFDSVTMTESTSQLDLTNTKPSCLVLVVDCDPSRSTSATYTADLVKSLLADLSAAEDIPTWVVTTGAANPQEGAANPPEVSTNFPAAGAVWALARSAAVERPHGAIRRFDVDLSARPEALRRAIRSGADECIIRDDRVWQGRLDRATAPTLLDDAPRKLPAGSIDMVVGGLGGLGLEVVTHLARGYSKRILAVGRRQPDRSVEEAIRAAETHRVRIEPRHVDISDPGAVAEFFRQLSAEGLSIRHLIHTAGSLSDALIGDVTAHDVDIVFAAKARGIDNVFANASQHGVSIEHVVLFSSATALHGNIGQAVYAAANGYLDSIASRSCSAGPQIVSLGWGVWGESGHVATDLRLQQQLTDRGFGAITTAEGLSVLDRALRERWSGHIGVLPNDWPTFVAAHDVEHQGYFSGLIATTTAKNASAQSTPPALARALFAETDPIRRTEILVQALCATAEHYLPSGQNIGTEDSLVEMGIDSLSLVQLRNEMQRELGVPLPSRLVTEFQTPSRIAAHIVRNVISQRLWEGKPSSSLEPHEACAGHNTSISLEQQRWLSLVTNAGYGRRVVPVFFHTRLDMSAMTHALAEALRIHKALRMSFPDGARTHVHEPEQLLIPEVYMSMRLVAQSDRPKVLADLMNVLLDDIPDPRLEPSWRLRVIDVDESMFLLLIAAEHLQFDGSGLVIFIDDVRDAYATSLRGEKPQLLASGSYEQYVAEQNAYRNSRLVSDRAVFRGLFAGHTRLTSLGDDWSGEAVARPAQRYTPKEPLSSWLDVLDIASELKISPFAVVLASYATLVHEITGDSAVCVSMIRSNRTEARFARVIGPFTMPFPVPIHVADLSPGELMEHVDESLQVIADHPQYPSTDLRSVSRAFNGLPFDTYFSDFGINFTHYRKSAESPDFDVEIVEVIGEVHHELLADYEFGRLNRVPGLHLVVEVDDKQVRVHYWYHDQRVSRGRLESWAERHRKMLRNSIRSVKGER